MTKEDQGVVLLPPDPNNIGFRVSKHPHWFTRAMVGGEIRPLVSTNAEGLLYYELEVEGENGLLLCRPGDTIDIVSDGWLTVRKTSEIAVTHIFDTEYGSLPYVAKSNYDSLLVKHKSAVEDLTEALRLTADYMGRALPALEGWSWFDALKKYAPEKVEEFEACVDANKVKFLEAHTNISSYRVDHRPAWYNEAVSQGDIRPMAHKDGNIVLRVFNTAGSEWKTCSIGQSIYKDPKGVLRVIE